MTYNPYNHTIRENSPNITATHFPHNIYGADIVHPLPYFTRDILNPETHFEHINNVVYREPHSRIKARWGWGHFPNGYGYGNFNTHWNCPTECDPDPKGYVSKNTQNTINFFKNSLRYR